MMDFTVASSTQTTSTAFPQMDILVTSGIAPFIDGDPGSVQAATLAAFIQLGSIPQLPGIGVPLIEYATGQASFGDLDAAIRQSAQNAQVANFAPSYSIIDGRLVVTMTASQQAGVQ